VVAYINARAYQSPCKARCSSDITPGAAALGRIAADTRSRVAGKDRKVMWTIDWECLSASSCTSELAEMASKYRANNSWSVPTSRSSLLPLASAKPIAAVLHQEI
jgi:hypothetical protein